VRLAVLLAAAALLAACGSKKPDPNVGVLASIPVYPGAAAPRTTTTGAFGARDWTLPAGTDPQTVVRWYERKLGARGWKLEGESFATVRATRNGASLSIGVRGRTLEAVANATGG
jgi:hypothetical protein